jgi:hypothetical protein
MLERKGLDGVDGFAELGERRAAEGVHVEAHL